MGIRATPKHAAGTLAALGETYDKQTPLIDVPCPSSDSVVNGTLTTFNILQQCGVLTQCYQVLS